MPLQDNVNLSTITQQAENALPTLRNIRDNATPTNAQVINAIQFMATVQIAQLRLLLNKTDATT
jgi:hypothetical protein